MNELRNDRKEYSHHTGAEDLVCTLCGKPGTIFFKNAFVCEDCLDYVKNSLLK